MKNYCKWSSKCKEITNYEGAKDKVKGLTQNDLIEFMNVANFISSKTFYGIVSNIVAIIAMFLSLIEPMSLVKIIIIVILIIVTILVIRGICFNKKMVNGANYALWAIHNKKSEEEVKAS